MSRWSATPHSKNASLRAAGNLGLRLSAMNKGGEKKRNWYGHKGD